MKRTEGVVSGWAVWLQETEGEVTASFQEWEELLDSLTIVTREAETVEDVRIPEETDLNMEAWETYAGALLAWVSQETGIPVTTLEDHWHPDVAEPYLRYRYVP